MKYTLKAILVMALGCLTYCRWQLLARGIRLQIVCQSVLWLDARFLEQRVRCASFGQAFGLDSG